MTRQRFTLGFAVIAVAAGAGLLYLDAAGVFIYFGYVPAVLLVLAVVLGGLFAAGRADRLRRTDVLIFGTVTLGLVVLTVVCPFLSTSQRKAFYLDAKSLRAGMSWEEVQHRMAAYPSFRKYADSVTFVHKSSPDTVDTVVVRLSKNGSQIASVEYSAD